MIARLTAPAHEQVLLFWEVNTSRNDVERDGSNLLEEVVQTDYLTRQLMNRDEIGFRGDLLAIGVAEPMFERVHRQFETVFDFKLAVN